eukprot:gnl/MRDRNA2_/MRDRNA2_63469_c0_seq2.p1 gnl/MRDRNA2_/MRDRNA2_63469_c0~~gnl/MRDRNA2_/MRDRNA2_63469_c0_seq2.p1  ORF type:complete len:478 (-),score=82.26 gnl/MRDRNA2_/MRDRNA2_63469_c0_seq2:24-1457(-)
MLSLVEDQKNKISLEGSVFEVPKKYEIIQIVGQGSYAMVCAAKNAESDEEVAIKKIEDCFEHIVIAKRILWELKVLRHMRHENVLDVKEVFAIGDKESFKDVYIVSELMETDLATFLKSTQAFTPEHCQFFLYQILCAMKYVHSSEVIHRDLKPRNILVNSNCDLKICDFGFARVDFGKDDHREAKMTESECIRTGCYRAPEFLCCLPKYTKGVDVWSTGCIFAEMILRVPIFPGRDTANQLSTIISIVGSPSEKAVSRIQNQKCKKLVESFKKQSLLREIFDDANPKPDRKAVDLMDAMLKFDNDERISMKDALVSGYMEQLHEEEDEPDGEPLDKREFDFDRRKIDEACLREELILEALNYFPQMQKEYKTFHSLDNYLLLEHAEVQTWGAGGETYKAADQFSREESLSGIFGSHCWNVEQDTPDVTHRSLGSASIGFTHGNLVAGLRNPSTSGGGGLVMATEPIHVRTGAFQNC